MDRSTTLILVGVCLLVVSVSFPVIQFVLTDWDTDYVYTTKTDGSFCADRVDGASTVEDGDFRIEYETLTPTGQQQFRRALTEGRYVVENEDDTATDFTFVDDFEAAGSGCYAVRYKNETYAVRTMKESQAMRPLDEPWPSILGRLLFAFGGGSLFAGSLLTVRRHMSA